MTLQVVRATKQNDITSGVGSGSQCIPPANTALGLVGPNLHLSVPDQSHTTTKRRLAETNVLRTTIAVRGLVPNSHVGTIVLIWSLQHPSQIPRYPQIG